MFVQGFSLIELMLAMAMGSLILLSLVQVVQASKTVYRVQEGLARLQESGRLAMDVLARDIRMSGFSGCSSNRTNSVGSELDSAEAGSLMSNFQGYRLEGVDDYDGQVPRYADVSPFGNRTASTRPVEGTDVLILRRPVGQPWRLAEPGDHRPGELRVWPVANQAPVEVGDLLLLSDCNRSRIFRATGSSTRQGATVVIRYSGDWATRKPVFQKGTEIYRLEGRMYYVRQGTRGDGNSLYLKEGEDHSPPQELVEGVEDMQILYGVGERRTRGLATRRFLSATEVENEQRWDQVTSVRLQLGFATLQGGLHPDREQNDARLRRDFVALVTLRNRAL